MKDLKRGWMATIAISVSESPDLRLLGMSDRHLRRATEVMATYLLSFGYRLAYGGDLRKNGFTEQLFELVSRYDRSPQSDGRPGVTDYLPWSACASISYEGYRDIADRLGNTAEIRCLGQDGSVLTKAKFPKELPEKREEVAISLTAMRRTMLEETEARVILGGRVEGYQGTMPGIAEEALLSLEAGKPLFLLGGFGGCARDVAEALQLIPPLHDPPRVFWDRYEAFSGFRPERLSNGLDFDENRTLARTPYILEAVNLVLRGLERTVVANDKAA